MCSSVAIVRTQAFSICVVDGIIKGQLPISRPWQKASTGDPNVLTYLRLAPCQEDPATPKAYSCNYVTSFRKHELRASTPRGSHAVIIHFLSHFFENVPSLGSYLKFHHVGVVNVGRVYTYISIFIYINTCVCKVLQLSRRLEMCILCSLLRSNMLRVRQGNQ